MGLECTPLAGAGRRRPGRMSTTAFLLSFLVSMLAFVFPSGLGVREGILALALAPRSARRCRDRARRRRRLVMTLVEIAFAVVVVVVERHHRRRSG